MATARREKPAFVPPPDVVVLELSEEEAQAIADVSGYIGGDHHNSPRRHWNAVEDALEAVGFTWRHRDPFVSDSGSVLGLTYKDA